VLEAEDGNIQLARQLFKCAVKADPGSEPSWLVRLRARRAALCDAARARSTRIAS
jgi:hypothetical protein